MLVRAYLRLLFCHEQELTVSRAGRASIALWLPGEQVSRDMWSLWRSALSRADLEPCHTVPLAWSIDQGLDCGTAQVYFEPDRRRSALHNYCSTDLYNGEVHVRLITFTPV